MQRGIWITLLILCLSFPGGRSLGADAFPEYKVKAAFLFNFVKFVKWPEGAFSSPEQPIEVAIVGSDPFGETLDATFRGKRLDGREVKITRAKQAAEATGAHLLFIARSEEAKLGEIMAGLGTRPVLTVSEIAGFARKEGMIELKVEEQQVCFDLNQRRLKQARLSAGGQMVKIARSVYQ